MATHPFHTDIQVFGPNGRAELDNNAGIAQAPQTLVNADTALDASHRGHIVMVDTTAGDIQIQLPASAVNLHRFFWTVKNSAGANNVIINRAGADTIQGGNGPVTLAAGEWTTLSLDNDNTNWASMLVRMSAGGALTVTPITAPATIAAVDSGTLYDVDTSGGAITQPLPDPTTLPAGFEIGFKLNGTNTLTLTPAAGFTIDEANTMDMTDDNMTIWLGVVNGQWGITKDHRPTQTTPQTNNGTVTIVPGTPQTISHNLGVRPVQIVFVDSTTGDKVELSCQQPDVNTATVDGNIARAYLWRASV